MQSTHSTEKAASSNPEAAGTSRSSLFPRKRGRPPKQVSNIHQNMFHSFGPDMSFKAKQPRITGLDHRPNVQQALSVSQDASLHDSRLQSNDQQQQSKQHRSGKQSEQSTAVVQYGNVSMKDFLRDVAVSMQLPASVLRIPQRDREMIQAVREGLFAFLKAHFATIGGLRFVFVAVPQSTAPNYIVSLELTENSLVQVPPAVIAMDNMAVRILHLDASALRKEMMRVMANCLRTSCPPAAAQWLQTRLDQVAADCLRTVELHCKPLFAHSRTSVLLEIL
jgi:hypothetical protein